MDTTHERRSVTIQTILICLVAVGLVCAVGFPLHWGGLAVGVISGLLVVVIVASNLEWMRDRGHQEPGGRAGSSPHGAH